MYCCVLFMPLPASLAWSRMIPPLPTCSLGSCPLPLCSAVARNKAMAFPGMPACLAPPQTPPSSHSQGQSEHRAHLAQYLLGSSCPHHGCCWLAAFSLIGGISWVWCLLVNTVLKMVQEISMSYAVILNSTEKKHKVEQEAKRPRSHGAGEPTSTWAAPLQAAKGLVTLRNSL